MIQETQNKSKCISFYDFSDSLHEIIDPLLATSKMMQRKLSPLKRKVAHCAADTLDSTYKKYVLVVFVQHRRVLVRPKMC